jgi:type III secretory pathway component EscU
MHTHQSTKRLILSRFSSRRAARLKERVLSEEDAAADDEESPDLRKERRRLKKEKKAAGAQRFVRKKDQPLADPTCVNVRTYCYTRESSVLWLALFYTLVKQKEGALEGQETSLGFWRRGYSL